MKLSLDALKERAEATASTEELLDTISGGTENSCHSFWDNFSSGVSLLMREFGNTSMGF